MQSHAQLSERYASWRCSMFPVFHVSAKGALEQRSAACRLSQDSTRTSLHAFVRNRMPEHGFVGFWCVSCCGAVQRSCDRRLSGFLRVDRSTFTCMCSCRVPLTHACLQQPFGDRTARTVALWALLDLLIQPSHMWALEARQPGNTVSAFNLPVAVFAHALGRYTCKQAPRRWTKCWLVSKG